MSARERAQKGLMLWKQSGVKHGVKLDASELWTATD
jgi:hypothetical protein